MCKNVIKIELFVYKIIVEDSRYVGSSVTPLLPLGIVRVGGEYLVSPVQSSIASVTNTRILSVLCIFQDQRCSRSSFSLYRSVFAYSLVNWTRPLSPLLQDFCTSTTYDSRLPTQSRLDLFLTFSFFSPSPRSHTFGPLISPPRSLLQTLVVLTHVFFLHNVPQSTPIFSPSPVWVCRWHLNTY